MFRRKIKPPQHLRARIEEVARNHGFASAAQLVEHFLTRGLARFPFIDPSTSLPEQIDRLVEERGYASAGEALEHLLLRGLRAYETPLDDAQTLEDRLRGLGYID